MKPSWPMDPDPDEPRKDGKCDHGASLGRHIAKRLEEELGTELYESLGRAVAEENGANGETD